MAPGLATLAFDGQPSLADSELLGSFWVAPQWRGAGGVGPCSLATPIALPGLNQLSNTDTAPTSRPGRSQRDFCFTKSALSAGQERSRKKRTWNVLANNLDQPSATRPQPGCHQTTYREKLSVHIAHWHSPVHRDAAHLPLGTLAGHGIRPSLLVGLQVAGLSPVGVRGGEGGMEHGVGHEGKSSAHCTCDRKALPV